MTLPAKPFAPEHLGGRECGGAAAHDHHALGVFARASRLARPAPRGRLDLLTHARLSVALVHAPARHRIERRRSDRLAGAQAEAGMVPRAAHGVADRQSLGERPAVVRAGRTDGEEFIAAARKQDRFLPDMSADHAAVGEVVERDALREIGTGRLRWLAHGRLLTSWQPKPIRKCRQQEEKNTKGAADAAPSGIPPLEAGQARLRALERLGEWTCLEVHSAHAAAAGHGRGR